MSIPAAAFASQMPSPCGPFVQRGLRLMEGESRCSGVRRKIRKKAVGKNQLPCFLLAEREGFEPSIQV